MQVSRPISMKKEGIQTRNRKMSSKTGKIGGKKQPRDFYEMISKPPQVNYVDALKYPPQQYMPASSVGYGPPQFAMFHSS